MPIFTNLRPFVRLFSTQPVHHFPLQPAKQRKTTPFRHPKRPHIIDPINIDPTARVFSLTEDPDILFVVREPKSLKTLDYGSLSRDPFESLEGEPNPSDSTPSSHLPGLSHPILSAASPTVSTYLPPPLRSPPQHPESLTPEILQEIRLLRPTHSLTQLSKKFGVSRISIQMLGFGDEESRTQIALRNELRNQRREKRWSVSKLARREEKRARRSLW
ncbi:uncharacterized protein MELLADRAFT_91663 [Melampsora larici-populina 98AG31]|uniref:Uncharacterized protein n=1 Tax=Melampsora larici-populina (strain 98AG31 / pathotype 3-4-7) TaxID=747676 RepID=F4RZV1_MELLP|nr:uncharacterized protein MELLADRAFT_91663 [Melampsora larici-populina 98AG31]EGG02065.1 hypothetical protein MELLADRAFT_91663 [Melampsora larici-populina 98AG31]